MPSVSSIDYPAVGTVARNTYLTPQGKQLSEFQWRVYDVLIKVPAGKVTTYGALARQLSSSSSQENIKRSKGSAQAVGNALRSNPFAPVVPCHRVVNSDLYIGGFFGDYGLPEAPDNESRDKPSRRSAGPTEPQQNQVVRKIELLNAEGIQVDSKGYLLGSREDLMWNY